MSRRRARAAFSSSSEFAGRAGLGAGGCASATEADSAPVSSDSTAQPGENVETAPVFDADYLSNPVPPYPPTAKRLKIQGEVIVRVLVNPDGKPESILLQKSSGATILDDAALSTVKRWSFVPARRGLKPISAWVDIPIRFRLN